MSVIVINQHLCSGSARDAFAALEQGKAIRRECWPEGQVVRVLESGVAGVVRHGSAVIPPWMGPSRAEQDATDWRVI